MKKQGLWVVPLIGLFATTLHGMQPDKKRRRTVVKTKLPKMSRYNRTSSPIDLSSFMHHYTMMEYKKEYHQEFKKFLKSRFPEKYNALAVQHLWLNFLRTKAQEKRERFVKEYRKKRELKTSLSIQ